jgi:predicted transcriptional regulator
MEKKNLADWINQQKINQVLYSFSFPKTPRQVEKQLRIKKLKLKPFLEKNLLRSLNPETKKGRLYILTEKARKLLGLYGFKKEGDKNWNLIGWIIASPKQRLVVLKTLAIDSAKRNSEKIRKRASVLNPCLSRISTKTVLRELVDKGLVETEMNGRYRDYWITEKGKEIIEDMERSGL